MSDEAHFPPGTLLDGKYCIEKLLGAGAMGAVYEVRDPDGRRFAAKTLLGRGLSTQDTDSIARFTREARVASGLSDPHVARVFDASFDRSLDTFFILMELLSGRDLDSQVSQTGALHPIAAVRIILQACRGVQAAHKAGIVHRDVKPSNLYLNQGDDGDVTVKVCDFGIAKVLDSDENLTGSGALLGTPLFMSPEQSVNSKRVDGRTDVWSLAMSLYHALAGAPAFAKLKTFPELVQALHMKEVPPLQDAAPWVDPDLACVVHGALIRDPDGRCPSAGALADALLPFAGGSDRVTRATLLAVSQELRGTPAPRATLPTTWRQRRLSITPPGRPEPLDDPLVGAMLAGRYQVQRVIGRGGMGTVYEAEATDGARVAIKAIRFDHGTKRTDAARRFMREARALTSIKSPYVVRVLDVDTDLERDLPFIVMELLQGNTIGALVKEHGAVDPARCARLFVQACEGISAAHQLGIVHRDIKPSNIFLHELPSGGVVPKICDFGVAKRTAVSETEETTADITHTGNVLGSPAYMSPEQARNAKQVDQRTDVWSLGMSLWEALAGRRPWETCTSMGELILAICTQEVTPLQQGAPWVPAGLADAVHRSLQRDPDERFPSMHDMSAALEAFASPDLEISKEALIASCRPVSTVGSGAGSAGVSASSNMARTVTQAGAIHRQRSRLSLVLAIGAALSLAGALGLYSAFHRAPAPGPALPSSAPSGPMALGSAATGPSLVPPTTGFVSIRPETAEVFVGGKRVEVQDGGVVVEGAAGEEIDVEARVGADSATARVTVGKDGTTAPSLVEVRPKARVGDGVRERDAGAHKALDAGAPAVSATSPGLPATTAPPPATPGQTTPVPVLKW